MRRPFPPMIRLARGLAATAAVVVLPVAPLLLFLPAPPAWAEGADKTLTSFAELRSEVLDAIGGASKRVWLVSDYLTDGEIVSALYLAQYRKLDVQVLLSRARANHYMSRLSYLKNQNIPVYLKPDTFKPGQPTALLADDRLVMIDGDLDFLAKVRQYQLTVGSAARRDEFQAAFSAAAGLKVPAVPQQTPLVGKYNPKSRIYSPGPSGTSDPQSAARPAASNAPGIMSSPGASGTVVRRGTQPRVDASGAYVYDRAGSPRPSDVPAKLPKAVKWGDNAARRPAPAKPNVTPPPADPKAPEAPQATEAQQESGTEPAPPTLPADGG